MCGSILIILKASASNAAPRKVGPYGGDGWKITDMDTFGITRIVKVGIRYGVLFMVSLCISSVIAVRKAPSCGAQREENLQRYEYYCSIPFSSSNLEVRRVTYLFRTSKQYNTNVIK